MRIIKAKRLGEWRYMRKLKVYLDTSVISYVSQEDAPERMKDTLKLWKDFENGKYDIYLSQVTLDEILKIVKYILKTSTDSYPQFL